MNYSIAMGKSGIPTEYYTFSMTYFDAAMNLYEAAKSKENQYIENSAYPIVFLIYHGIELILKDICVLEYLVGLIDKATFINLKNKHDLIEIFNYIEKIKKIHGINLVVNNSNVDFGSIKTFLNDLAQYEKCGFCYRYPYNLNANITSENYIFSLNSYFEDKPIIIDAEKFIQDARKIFDYLQFLSRTIGSVMEKNYFNQFDLKFLTYDNTCEIVRKIDKNNIKNKKGIINIIKPFTFCVSEEDFIYSQLLKVIEHDRYLSPHIGAKCKFIATNALNVNCLIEIIKEYKYLCEEKFPTPTDSDFVSADIMQIYEYNEFEKEHCTLVLERFDQLEIIDFFTIFTLGRNKNDYGCMYEAIYDYLQRDLHLESYIAKMLGNHGSLENFLKGLEKIGFITYLSSDYFAKK